ncbi:MAG: molybdopterin-dependent oxidoreductase [Coriobacteriales bacterium]|jgi:anaerobic selenocysteine-containing dehydrogenase|nr:molybdopterin-dependent oxidoreductase [Coriobacteriales bacterium]
MSEKPLTKLPDNMPNGYVDEEGVTWKYTHCFMCHMACRVMAGVNQEGKVCEIRNVDGSTLCDRLGHRGENAIKQHYHPKRINHALKRVGPKGTNQFEEISYDQALDEISAKLDELKAKYGPETLCIAEGTYRSDHMWARSRFSNLFGNPGNIIDPGTICWCYTYTVNMSMVGWPIETTLPMTVPYSNCIVIWGIRPDEKCDKQGPLWKALRAALDREGEKPKLIVVDPVAISLVQEADHWICIKPGTDLYMQMTWVGHIIKNKLYDADFVKDYTNAPFLVKASDNILVRGCDIDKDGKYEDFVAWNDKTGAPAIWCSDENHYYDAEVDAPIEGTHKIKLADGSEIEVRTVFDAIAERAVEYTPEKAEQVCGVPARITQAAIETYATTKPGCIAWGIGGGDGEGPNAHGTTIAKTLLRCLTGNIDIVGGEYIAVPGPIGPNGEKLFPVRDSELEIPDTVKPEIRKKFLGNDQFRIMSWEAFEKGDAVFKKNLHINRPQQHQMLVSPPVCWKAIEEHDPYPVTAMICYTSNPLIWAPNTKHVYNAMKKLELLVVLDYWKTPTAAIADYILPAADWLERPYASTVEDSLDFFDGGDRVVQPLYDRHLDYDFFRELGIRQGQAEQWPWETYEDLIKYRIERVGWDYDSFMTAGSIPPVDGFREQKYLDDLPNGQKRGFVTQSRKCELIPSIIQECGYDPIPEYVPMPESEQGSPELLKDYPLVLTTGGRFTPMYHSEQRVPGYGNRSQFPDPLVKINMHDAKIYGIRQGENVWIETPRGRIMMKAWLGWDLPRGTVQAQASWWMPELPAEEPWSQGLFISNANVLTDDKIEDLDECTGTWTTRGLLCKIYPCVDPWDRSDTSEDLDSYIASGGGVWKGIYENIDPNVHGEK